MGGEGLSSTRITNASAVAEESPLPHMKYKQKYLQNNHLESFQGSNPSSSQNKNIPNTIPLDIHSKSQYKEGPFKTASVASLNCSQRVSLKQNSISIMSQSSGLAYNTMDRDSICSSENRLPHISGSSCAPDIITSHPIRNDCPGIYNLSYDVPLSNTLPEGDACLERINNRTAVDHTERIAAGGKSVGIEVQHVRQQHSWDCGIACVMMVLSETHRSHLHENLADICEQEGFQKSTWTIDLAYLLRRFGVPFRYYTITLGVDPGLTSERFYQQAIYKDAMRVVERFQAASRYGVTVQQLTVSLACVVQHLSHGLPIIVLTNARMLRCRLCPRRSLRSCFANACQSNDHYQGHFVVLAGVDRSARLIYYANPSSREPLCCCSFQQMEEARLSYGTDQDIIFVDQ